MNPRPIQDDGLLHGVVVACRDPRDSARLLCIRRSAHVAAPLQICFPGGAVERGESYEQAAIREMAEELGAAIVEPRQVWQWRSSERNLLLRGFIALLETAPEHLAPDPQEVAEVHWLTGAEAASHADAMATNRDFVRAIEAYERQTGSAAGGSATC